MVPLQSGNLKTHKHTHTSEKSFKCDICGSCFSQNGHLKSHLRTHTGEKPFKCDCFGLWFSDNSSLKRHCALILDIWPVCIDSKSKLETVFVFSSTVEKPFKCDVYQVRLSRSDSLKTYAHPYSESPFKCDIHVCFMLFPKYSLENSSDPILCPYPYTGKKLFKSNRLQFSQNRCLNTQYVLLY